VFTSKPGSEVSVVAELGIKEPEGDDCSIPGGVDIRLTFTVPVAGVRASLELRLDITTGP